MYTFNAVNECLYLICTHQDLVKAFKLYFKVKGFFFFLSVKQNKKKKIILISDSEDSSWLSLTMSQAMNLSI